MSDIPTDPIAAIDWLLDPMAADRRFQWHAQAVLMMARRALAAHREAVPVAWLNEDGHLFTAVGVRVAGFVHENTVIDPRWTLLYTLPPAPAAEPPDCPHTSGASKDAPRNPDCYWCAAMQPTGGA